MRWTKNIPGILGAHTLRGREGWRMRVASGFIALVVLVGTLTMLGCGGDDDGDNNTSTPPAPGSNLTNATASNLANRVFTFPTVSVQTRQHLPGSPQDNIYAALWRFRWHQYRPNDPGIGWQYRHWYGHDWVVYLSGKPEHLSCQSGATGGNAIYRQSLPD